MRFLALLGSAVVAVGVLVFYRGIVFGRASASVAAFGAGAAFTAIAVA